MVVKSDIFKIEESFLIILFTIQLSAFQCILKYRIFWNSSHVLFQHKKNNIVQVAGVFFRDLSLIVFHTSLLLFGSSLGSLLKWTIHTRKMVPQCQILYSKDGVRTFLILCPAYSLKQINDSKKTCKVGIHSLTPYILGSLKLDGIHNKIFTTVYFMGCQTIVIKYGGEGGGGRGGVK